MFTVFEAKSMRSWWALGPCWQTIRNCRREDQRGATGARTGRQPVRVVLDSRLHIPFKAKVLQWVHEQPTIVCTTAQASPKKIQTLREQDVQVWVLPQKKGRVSLKASLAQLGKEGMSSVLLEGGSTLNASALHEGLVNQVRLYIAPLLMGGQDAKSLIGGVSPKTLEQAWRLVKSRTQKNWSGLAPDGKH